MQFIALSLYLSIYLIENIGYLREGFNKKAMSFLFTVTNKEQIFPQIYQQEHIIQNIRFITSEKNAKHMSESQNISLVT